MGATKQHDARGGESAQSDSERRDSGVATSGVREPDASERETTPAPPSSEAWAQSVFSARPTSVPDYDVAAIALETSLRHAPLPALPLDITVPARTGTEPPPGLELRLAFLLLHTDGRSSIRDIAEATSIPAGDVLEAFVQLAHAGLVDLAGTQSAGREVPISGIRTAGGRGGEPDEPPR